MFDTQNRISELTSSTSLKQNANPLLGLDKMNMGVNDYHFGGMSKGEVSLLVLDTEEPI